MSASVPIQLGQAPEAGSPWSPNKANELKLCGNGKQQHRSGHELRGLREVSLYMPLPSRIYHPRCERQALNCPAPQFVKRHINNMHCILSCSVLHLGK